MKLRVLIPIAATLAMACVPLQAKTKEHGSKVTVKGCLTKGTQPNEYAIVENGVTYDLIPTGKVDMAPHVGHRVEVTGKTADMGQATPNTANRTTTERVDVKTLKHLSKTCP